MDESANVLSALQSVRTMLASVKTALVARGYLISNLAPYEWPAVIKNDPSLTATIEEELVDTSEMTGVEKVQSELCNVDIVVSYIRQAMADEIDDGFEYWPPKYWDTLLAYETMYTTAFKNDLKDALLPSADRYSLFNLLMESGDKEKLVVRGNDVDLDKFGYVNELYNGQLCNMLQDTETLIIDNATSLSGSLYGRNGGPTDKHYSKIKNIAVIGTNDITACPITTTSSGSRTQNDLNISNFNYLETLDLSAIKKIEDYGTILITECPELTTVNLSGLSGSVGANGVKIYDCPKLKEVTIGDGTCECAINIDDCELESLTHNGRSDTSECDSYISFADDAHIYVNNFTTGTTSAKSNLPSLGSARPMWNYPGTKSYVEIKHDNYDGSTMKFNGKSVWKEMLRSVAIWLPVIRPGTYEGGDLTISCTLTDGFSRMDALGILNDAGIDINGKTITFGSDGEGTEFHGTGQCIKDGILFNINVAAFVTALIYGDTQPRYCAHFMLNMKGQLDYDEMQELIDQANLASLEAYEYWDRIVNNIPRV